MAVEYSYELTIVNRDDIGVSETADILEEASTFFNGDICWLEILYGSGTWITQKEDMCSFSKDYPDAIFELKAVGEESSDIWKERWKNGKHETVLAEVTFPEFKEIVDKKLEC